MTALFAHLAWRISLRKCSTVSRLLWPWIGLAACGASHAGMYFAEMPGHPELVILTAPNTPASGTIWMRCAIGQTWDPAAAGPRGGQGSCTGTAKSIGGNATAAEVSTINTANFGGYGTWMVPTAENIGSLFPPETPKDLPETWPCTKQVLPTGPCWGEAITDNDLFRNTPTDKPFLSSTTFFGISRLVADFKTGKTVNQSPSASGYLRLMVPATGLPLQTVTVTTSTGGGVDSGTSTTATRQQLRTGGAGAQHRLPRQGPCAHLRQLHQHHPNRAHERDRPFGWNGKLVCADALLATGGSTTCTFTYLTPGYQVTATPGSDT